MLKAPPYLLAAALVFWGWETRLLLVAAPLAFILEASRHVQVRWSFSVLDYRRIWSVCTILFLGATLFAFASSEGASAMSALFDSGSPAQRIAAMNQSTRSVLLLFQYLPLVFFPMIAAQAYSSQATIELGTFSWLARYWQSRRQEPAPPGINIAFPYMAVCLIGSSAANSQDYVFFPGFVLLVGWGLWSQRTHRFSAIAWIMLNIQ